MLYASTGDAGARERAQDVDAISGKILRMTLDGRAAEDNPFDNRVWSYGHRNVEGLAFDTEGRLWAAEFGDQQTDELNLIERGANYGWPQTEGPTDAEGITGPKAWWSTDDASPAGVGIVHGTAYVAALRGRCVWAVPLSGEDARPPAPPPRVGRPRPRAQRRPRTGRVAVGDDEQHRRTGRSALRRRPHPARHGRLGSEP